MPYEIYSDHPESQARREENFTAWMFWAQDAAPWSGIGIDEMAAILQTVCAREGLEDECTFLDTGGTLSPKGTRAVLRLAEDRMGKKTREIFSSAVRNGYGVRVVFSQGSFGKAMSASAYLAKQESAPEH